MPYFYCIHTRYRNDSKIHKDTILTADNVKEAETNAKHKLAGGPYDDGSLPEFVKAERLSRAEAQKLYDQNPIDWIEHDEMRNSLD